MEIIYQEINFCAATQKDLINIVLPLKSEARIVLNLSLIFEQISAWCPYKLGPYKKKRVYMYPG